MYVWTSNSNHCYACKQNKKYNSKPLFALWCVCMYACVRELLERVWIVLRVCDSQCSVNVEVVSARRGNLLYKRRADVSYVYPRSHSTKEPCIPSHSNPRPGLSWFSDINYFLFHFPYFFLSFFSSPHVLLSREQREALCGTDLDFWSVVRESQRS